MDFDARGLSFLLHSSSSWVPSDVLPPWCLAPAMETNSEEVEIMSEPLRDNSLEKEKFMDNVEKNECDDFYNIDIDSNDDISTSDTTSTTEPSPSFKCRLCSKVFPTKIRLMEHRVNHKSFKCTYCTKEFSEKVHLIIHTRIHTGERPYVCSLCGRGFTVNGNLQKHMRIHYGEKPYVCHLCDKAFAERGNLTRHVKTVHSDKKGTLLGNVQAKIKCKNISFISKSALDVPIKSSNNSITKSIQNEISNKTILKNTPLVLKGKVRHVNMKKNVGDTSRIPINDDSQYHDSNTRECLDKQETKSFKCMFCPKEFTHRVRLVIHTRIHTGERPYTCTFCSKSFHVQGNLQKHLRIHYQQKPYTCPICKRAFVEKGNLTRHVKKVHAAKDNVNNGNSETILNTQSIISNQRTKKNFSSVNSKIDLIAEKLTKNLTKVSSNEILLNKTLL